MKAAAAILLGLTALLVPALAEAHPHIWIQQAVRPVVTDGKYTHVDIEWRFDPFTSEVEIPAIDEDNDGKFSPSEIKALENDMLPELMKVGFMTWLNIGVGTKDVRPAKMPVVVERIADPAIFILPADVHADGEKDEMHMPPNKRVGGPPGPRATGPRNLVYVMRFELPKPTKILSVTTYDPEDFIRVEVDKSAMAAGCTLGKHPTYKSEFIPGHPVPADIVTCRLP